MAGACRERAPAAVSGIFNKGLRRSSITSLRVLVCTGSPEPGSDDALQCRCSPHRLSLWLKRCLGPQIRELESILSQQSVIWKRLLVVLQSSRQCRVQRKGMEVFISPAYLHPQKNLMKCVISFALSALQPESHF